MSVVVVVVVGENTAEEQGGRKILIGAAITRKRSEMRTPAFLNESELFARLCDTDDDLAVIHLAHGAIIEQSSNTIAYQIQ